MRTSRLAAFGLCGAVITALGAAGSEAHAQTPSELAAAQRWFAEGLAFEGAGRWRDALERFRRVAAVKHTPQVDFHVGLGEEHVGELVAATVNLRRALDAASAQHVANVERAATTELEQLRPRVPHLQIVVPAAATITRVVLDERSIAVVALAEPIAVDPGAHVVTVSFASGDVTRKMTFEERGSLRLTVDPPAERASVAMRPGDTSAPATTDTAASSGSASADATSATNATSATGGGNTTPGWILVGAGGAAVIGGAVFWALRGHQVSTLDAACGAGGEHCPDSVKSSYDTGKTESAVSVALFAAGAAAVGGGIVWVLTHGSHGEASHDGRSPAKDAFLTPLFLPGGGGAALSARF